MARPKKEEAVVETNSNRPRITDAEWSDWVLEQLRDNEKDPLGNPKVNGLRRLANEVLGPVVSSVPRVVEGPNENNGFRAVVEHHISIRWGGDKTDIRVFGAASDVYMGNTDQEYARYATATADTRSESRALRKALMLSDVVASEEISGLSVFDAGLDNLITSPQLTGIDYLCREQRLNIDVKKFMNSGEFNYEHPSQITFPRAEQMLEKLNYYTQNMDKIPTELKGYDPNWKKV